MPSKLFLERIEKIPEEVKRLNRLSMEIAYKIGKFLDEKPMTQRKFAELMGKKESEISRWLSGKHNFTLETLAKIETALKVKLLEIPLEASPAVMFSRTENKVNARIGLNSEKFCYFKNVKDNIGKTSFQSTWKNFGAHHYNYRNFLTFPSAMINENMAINKEIMRLLVTHYLKSYEDIFCEKDELHPVKTNSNYFLLKFNTNSKSTCSITQ